MHDVLVNRLGGLNLPRKSVVRLTDRPDMTVDVYRGRKITMQHAALTLSRPDTNSADQVQMLSSAASDQCQRGLLFYAKYNENIPF